MISKVWTRYYSINDWYKVYKEYQKFERRVVKVTHIYDYDEKSFTMEGIRGENLKDVILENRISFHQKQNILEQITHIFSNMFKFKSRECDLFWHDDLQLKNFIYTYDNDVKLIDPDSFIPIKFDNNSHYEFEIGKFTNTINNLHMSLIK